MTTVDATSLRCSAQMRLAGADPIGTAGSQDGYLLVEWPRPWPRDMAEITELAPVRAALDGRRIRLQGLVPEQAGSRRVILYRKSDGPFSGYERSEQVVAVGDGSAAVPGDPVAVGDALGVAARGLVAAASGLRASEPSVGTDVLVCTHGRRDRCCGSFGTQLWQALEADGAVLGPDARLWRTSHTGGHRFAATMIVLPEGTMWGFLDTATAGRIVRREGTVTSVLDSYRGCAGLPSPAVQALERSVLAAVGWDVLDTPRIGEELDGGRVRLVLDPEGRAEVWQAQAVAGREIPVPECGAPLDEARKTSTEWAVTGVTRVTR